MTKKQKKKVCKIDYPINMKNPGAHFQMKNNEYEQVDG